MKISIRTLLILIAIVVGQVRGKELKLNLTIKDVGCRNPLNIIIVDQNNWKTPWVGPTYPDLSSEDNIKIVKNIIGNNGIAEVEVDLEIAENRQPLIYDVFSIFVYQNSKNSKNEYYNPNKGEPFGAYVNDPNLLEKFKSEDYGDFSEPIDNIFELGSLSDNKDTLMVTGSENDFEIQMIGSTVENC